MTLVGPGTWEAARAAVDCALTAVDLVESRGRPGGVRALPAARPPRHPRRGTAAPATSTTPRSPRRGSATPGTRRVAVVDLDAHHGNGTQAIFWERADVRYASTHVDPAAGWFPHFFGHAAETGAGAGEGATRQPAAGRGHQRRRLARGGRATLAESRRRRRRAGRLPGRRRRRRRPGEPAPGHRRRVRRRRAPARVARRPERGRPGGRLPPAQPRRPGGGVPRRARGRLLRPRLASGHAPYRRRGPGRRRAAGCCSRSATSGARPTPRSGRWSAAASSRASRTPRPRCASSRRRPG